VLLAIAAIVAGLVLLTKAADQFVLGAARLAAAMRLSAVVIGAVIIGFGTSAPELLVSAIAAAQDEADIGIGNIIGSNVANLTLILGVASLVTPIVVASSVIRREAPMAIGSMVLLGVLVQGGISAFEGVVLITVLVAAITALLRGARVESEPDLAEDVAEFVDGAPSHPIDREAARTVMGLLLTLVGAHLLVTGAVDVADRLGLTGGFVGLTLVAVGTSLPELVTSVVAARKGETDLIVGNLLGSNLFNSLAVGGAVGLVGPGTVGDPTLTGLATLLMIGAGMAAVVMMWQGDRLAAREGGVLLGGYALTLPFLA
jgi:cation:H+ antiporter